MGAAAAGCTAGPGWVGGGHGRWSTEPGAGGRCQQPAASSQQQPAGASFSLPGLRWGGGGHTLGGRAVSTRLPLLPPLGRRCSRCRWPCCCCCCCRCRWAAKQAGGAVAAPGGAPGRACSGRPPPAAARRTGTPPAHLEPGWAACGQRQRRRLVVTALAWRQHSRPWGPPRPAPALAGCTAPAIGRRRAAGALAAPRGRRRSPQARGMSARPTGCCLPSPLGTAARARCAPADVAQVVAVAQQVGAQAVARKEVAQLGAAHAAEGADDDVQPKLVARQAAQQRPHLGAGAGVGAGRAGRPPGADRAAHSSMAVVHLRRRLLDGAQQELYAVHRCIPTPAGSCWR
jgi:hypothetical protein